VLEKDPEVMLTQEKLDDEAHGREGEDPVGDEGSRWRNRGG
jgi:hypothetical protein